MAKNQFRSLYHCLIPFKAVIHNLFSRLTHGLFVGFLVPFLGFYLGQQVEEEERDCRWGLGILT
jgi:hypothetical protein